MTTFSKISCVSRHFSELTVSERFEIESRNLTRRSSLLILKWAVFQLISYSRSITLHITIWFIPDYLHFWTRSFEAISSSSSIWSNNFKYLRPCLSGEIVKCFQLSPSLIQEGNKCYGLQSQLCWLRSPGQILFKVSRSDSPDLEVNIYLKCDSNAASENILIKNIFVWFLLLVGSGRVGCYLIWSWSKPHLHQAREENYKKSSSNDTLLLYSICCLKKPNLNVSICVFIKRYLNQ